MERRFYNSYTEGHRRFWSFRLSDSIFIYYDFLHNGVGYTICIWKFGAFIAKQGQVTNGDGWLVIRWGSKRWNVYPNKERENIKFD